MFNFKKLFGKGKQEQPKADIAEPAKAPEVQPQVNTEEGLPLIAPEDNPWNIELLDLRPVTLNRISTSKDPQMAANAVSYGGEDGTVFWNQQPQITKTKNTQKSNMLQRKTTPLLYLRSPTPLIEIRRKISPPSTQGYYPRTTQPHTPPTKPPTESLKPKPSNIY